MMHRCHPSPGCDHSARAIDVMVDLVFGAVCYRMMIPYEPLDDTFVNRLITQVFEGLLTVE